jgi:hypothetical protein
MAIKNPTGNVTELAKIIKNMLTTLEITSSHTQL